MSSRLTIPELKYLDAGSYIYNDRSPLVVYWKNALLPFSGEFLSAYSHRLLHTAIAEWLQPLLITYSRGWLKKIWEKDCR